MDNETKKFFEELAGSVKETGIEEAETEADIEVEPKVAKDEYKPKLAKASPAPLVVKEKKGDKEDKKEIEIKEDEEKVAEETIFDEEEGKLTIDVYQTPNEIIVESTIAGVRPEDLDISINNESVTIRGRREKEQRISDEDYFYQECYWGKFSRSIILPQEVDAENATANLKNGVLTIRLPKLNRQKSKKLKVKLD